MRNSWLALPCLFALTLGSTLSVAASAPDVERNNAVAMAVSVSNDPAG